MKLILENLSHEGYNKIVDYLNNMKINELYNKPIIQFSKVNPQGITTPSYKIEMEANVESILDNDMKKKVAGTLNGLVEIILEVSQST